MLPADSILEIPGGGDWIDIPGGYGG